MAGGQRTLLDYHGPTPGPLPVINERGKEYHPSFKVGRDPATGKEIRLWTCDCDHRQQTPEGSVDREWFCRHILMRRDQEWKEHVRYVMRLKNIPPESIESFETILERHLEISSVKMRWILAEMMRIAGTDPNGLVNPDQIHASVNDLWEEENDKNLIGMAFMHADRRGWTVRQEIWIPERPSRHGNRAWVRRITDEGRKEWQDAIVRTIPPPPE